MQPFIRSFLTDDENKVGPSFTHSPSLIRVKLVQRTPIITTLQKNYSKNLCWTKLQPSTEFAPYHAYRSREAQTNKQTQNCVLLYWRHIQHFGLNMYTCVTYIKVKSWWLMPNRIRKHEFCLFWIKLNVLLQLNIMFFKTVKWYYMKNFSVVLKSEVLI